MTRSQGTRRDNQAVIRGLGEYPDRAVDFAAIVHVDCGQLYPQRRRHGLNGGELPDYGSDAATAGDAGLAASGPCASVATQGALATTSCHEVRRELSMPVGFCSRCCEGVVVADRVMGWSRRGGAQGGVARD